MTASHVNIVDFIAELPGKIVGRTYEFPILHTTGGTWQIVCALEVGGADVDILPEYFRPSVKLPAGARGKTVVRSYTTLGNLRPSAATYVSKGKNIGKANETNVWCQALRDALGKYNHRLRSVGKPTGLAPMLAKIYEARKFSAPAWVSPKLDGLRCILRWEDGRVQFISRGGKEFPQMAVIVEEVAPMLAATGLVLDGEIYKHGMPLQEINRVKRATGVVPEAELMEYHCYDCIDSAIFEERLARLQRSFAEYGLPAQRVKLVEHRRVSTASEVDKFYREYLAAGYEGLICRYNRPYEGKRSSALVKLKPTLDAEFELVDWAAAESGKAAGLLMLQFKTPAGKLFWATPALPEAERRKLASEMPTEFGRWRGKMLTVEYAELSTDGVPQQPRTRMLERVD
jgi:ATP-dependent DNA ligase